MGAASAGRPLHRHTSTQIDWHRAARLILFDLVRARAAPGGAAGGSEQADRASGGECNYYHTRLAVSEHCAEALYSVSGAASVRARRPSRSKGLAVARGDKTDGRPGEAGASDVTDGDTRSRAEAEAKTHKNKSARHARASRSARTSDLKSLFYLFHRAPIVCSPGAAHCLRWPPLVWSATRTSGRGANREQRRQRTGMPSERRERDASPSTKDRKFKIARPSGPETQVPVKSGGRSPKPEARSPKPQARSQKPEAKKRAR